MLQRITHLQTLPFFTSPLPPPPLKSLYTLPNAPSSHKQPPDLLQPQSTHLRIYRPSQPPPRSANNRIHHKRPHGRYPIHHRQEREPDDKIRPPVRPRRKR
ncbi:hypothetical protein I7I50_10959 [Histoplasma capsulatum G186AR]|uniref:Uncharacterized protein n=1 Tax=Ajellomyces capsulatus TaxID=5037 RepID=A0A8H8D6Q8_AJECA|nr:hypothetical protein I7I52_02197 [Histoplasma capsulatum]QSS69609.1 hypothetical protein I7I50_10959 [Histoplasma capsulatum G186AR]